MHFRSVCDSLGEFAEVVGKSSSSSVPKLNNSGQGWQWYNWKGFLYIYLRKVTGPRKYAYFRFSQDKPGIVFVRQRIGDEETARCLMKRGVEPSNAMCLAMLKPPGLSLDRQNYLFKQIWPFCKASLSGCCRPWAPETEISWTIELACPLGNLSKQNQLTS